MFFLGFFFFQAEDGIRDLVRSRGLGDVYKRQVYVLTGDGEFQEGQIYESLQATAHQKVNNITAIMDHNKSVSYTHLTLPTSDLV